MMRAFFQALAVAFELAASTCAMLSESQDDRDERLQRSELDRLWQQTQGRQGDS